MKILGFTRGTKLAEMDAVQYYRTYLPLREVHRHDNGIEAHIISQAAVAGMTDDQLGGRDVYTMCRMYGDDYQAFVDEIHKRGGVLVLDSDDDLTEDYKLVSARGEEFKRVLGAVDYVTTSTQALADHFAQFTKVPPTVLRNHIDVDWMVKISSKAKRIVQGLTIGFSGSPTHWGDWRKPSVPFAHILREYDVQGVLHGEVPRYLTYAAKNLVRLGGVPYAIYPVVLKQFDIVLCAVDACDPFNAGKSAVKALEAMAVGAVPICSRFGPYIELYKAGAPVILVDDDTPDGWYYAMCSLIERSYDRMNLKSYGISWLKEHRDMSRLGYKEWENFYREIAD
jgi:glycosyltransferase involved in cell wall biosynthesis